MSLFKFVISRAFREILMAKQRSFLVILCIAVGISAISAVQFYVGSIENYFASNVKAISGGDIVIDLPDQLGEEERAFFEEGADSGRFIYTVTGESQEVLFSDRQSAMITLKQVDPGVYPLYGNLAIIGREDPFAGRQLLSEGNILLSGTTLSNLGASVGDSVSLNGEAYIIGGELEQDAAMDTRDNPFAGIAIIALPSSSIPLSGWHMIPGARGLLKLNDPSELDEIYQEASYVFERMRGSGPSVRFHRTDDLGEDNGSEPQTYIPVRTYLDTADEIQNISQQIGDFLLIVGLTSLLLGGLGIYSAVGMMVKQKMKDIAIIKCFGGRPSQIISIFGIQILVLAIVGIILGLVSGVLLAALIPNIVQELMPLRPGLHLEWDVIWRVSLIGLMITVFFSIIPIMDALKVKPLLLYRQESMGSSSLRNNFVMPLVLVLLMAGVFGSVISTMINSWAIGMGFSFGTLAIIAFLYIPVKIGIGIVCRLPVGRSIGARLGLKNIRRQRGRAASSVLSIGIGVAAVLLVTLLQINVVGSLEEALSDSRAYNVMIMGVSSDQTSQIKEYVSDKEYLDAYASIVSVSGTFTEINGKSFQDYQGPPNVQQVVERATVAGIAPEDEYFKLPLVTGNWLSSGEQGMIVSDEIADLIALDVGDVLTFTTSEGEREFTVVGIAESNSSGIRVGFEASFMVPEVDARQLLTPGRSREMFMLRTKEGYEGQDAVNDLRAQFPELGMILDLGQIIDILYRIMSASTRFMQFLGAFSVFAGGVILSGMIILTKYQRRKDIAVIRCLGGDTVTVLSSNLFEYGAIGLLAGALGVIASNLIVAPIVVYVLQSTFMFDPVISIGSLVLAMVFAGLVGMLSIADILYEKPLKVLKHE